MKKKYIYTIFLFAAVLSSCNGHDSEDPDKARQRVTSVDVFCQRPLSAPAATREGDQTEEENSDEFIITEQFTIGDKLYFSQLPPVGDPNFETYNEKHPLYIYEYNGKTATETAPVDWNNGFNFSLPEGSPIFEWETVKEIGSVGNAFSLYAMYFPVGNEYRLKVEDDQRGPENDRYDTSNFAKSDIMGAYHATSSLYTRLRFRLFHLMVYLKVKLYVPKYTVETVENPDTGHEYTYSGFKENAALAAYVMNAYTTLNIEWRANRSSDTEAPLTQQPTGETKNIVMYRHEPKNTTVTIEPKDFYTGDSYGEDEVLAYEFSVLFPMQSFGDNFLCFELQAPESNENDGSGEKRYYYFSASQIVGDKSESYGLTQGTLQELHLYLPRKTNETVLVAAKILPWTPAVTDMTVTKEDKTN